MKLKLRLSRERKDQIVDELNDLGIVVSEESELILTEEVLTSVSNRSEVQLLQLKFTE